MNDHDLEERMLSKENLTADQLFMFMLLDRVNKLEEMNETYKEKIHKLESTLYPEKRTTFSKKEQELLDKIKSKKQLNDSQEYKEILKNLSVVPQHVLDDLNRTQKFELGMFIRYDGVSITRIANIIDNKALCDETIEWLIEFIKL